MCKLVVDTIIIQSLVFVSVASSCNRLSIHHRLSHVHVLTCPSPKVLYDVSQLLAPAYHRVAALVMLRDSIQFIHPY